jgi:hypothetical protein
VSGAVALGLSPVQIAAGIDAALSKNAHPGALIPGGVAVFDLPATRTRPEGGLLVLTPAHNVDALEAWGRHLQENFPGRRAQLIVEPAADWLATETPAIIQRISEYFSGIAIALNSQPRSLVEAGEMARAGNSDGPFAQHLDLTAGVDQLLEGHVRADLVCVAPPNAGGFVRTLRYLETKGLSRRSVSGLASVRHCR